MRYVPSFEVFLGEALKPSQFRDFVKLWKEAGGDKIKDEWFGSKHRIEIPYIRPQGKKTVDEYTTEYMVTKHLKSQGYVKVDYEEGFALKPDGRKVKIGKLLEGSLKKAYDEDSTRLKNLQSDLKIILSRHAYDVAGQSTDRSWWSCKSLGAEGGMYDKPGQRFGTGPEDKSARGRSAEYVRVDVEKAVLIAYLVRKDDINIRNPLARIMINPYVSEDGDGTVFYYPSLRVYPKEYGGFRDSVLKWLEEKQKDMPYSTYCMVPGVYRDHNPPTVLPKNDKVEEMVRISEKADMDVEKVYQKYQELSDKEKKVLIEMGFRRLSSREIEYLADLWITVPRKEREKEDNFTKFVLNPFSAQDVIGHAKLSIEKKIVLIMSSKHSYILENLPYSMDILSRIMEVGDERVKDKYIDAVSKYHLTTDEFQETYAYIRSLDDIGNEKKDEYLRTLIQSRLTRPSKGVKLEREEVERLLGPRSDLNIEFLVNKGVELI